MFNFLADALDFIYEIWPSFGGAIILFTLAIMLVLSPLSIKSARRMIRMQRLQPELKKLQTQYKGDREGLNREMMAFYQANNVNPFSSCLPLLLQMPVFIILYRVLSGLTQKAPDETFSPKYLDPDSALRAALESTTEMMSFGMDLSKSALTELQQDGLLVALPFLVLVALTVATQFYQQRQIQGRNMNSSANPQQQMIMKVMPLVFIPITLSIPAGVVIYFVVSNLVRIGQQALVTRLEFGEGKGGSEIIVPKPQSPPSKGGVAADSKPSRTTTSGRVTPAGGAAGNRNRNKRKRK